MDDEIRMKVRVQLLPSGKQTRVVELKKGSDVEELVRTLRLFPDAWIAVRGATPLPMDERLEDGDEIKLIAVISGG